MYLCLFPGDGLKCRDGPVFSISSSQKGNIIDLLCLSLSAFDLSFFKGVLLLCTVVYRILVCFISKSNQRNREKSNLNVNIKVRQNASSLNRWLMPVRWEKADIL